MVYIQRTYPISSADQIVAAVEIAAGHKISAVTAVIAGSVRQKVAVAIKPASVTAVVDTVLTVETWNTVACVTVRVAVTAKAVQVAVSPAVSVSTAVISVRRAGTVAIGQGS